MEKGITESFDLARLGEDEACSFLRKNLCKILERNYRTRAGEIDIVARLGKIVIFAEVKTRSATDYAQPWEAVGYRKRQKLKTTAKMYVQQHASRECEFRFDVISITFDDGLRPQIEWMQNAF